MADDITYSTTCCYSVALPEVLDVDQTTNLVLETVRAHATYSFPTEAAQSDRQALKCDEDLFVLSPYKTLVQRTRFACIENRCHPSLVADDFQTLEPLDPRSSVIQNPKKPPSRRKISRPRVPLEALSRTGRSAIFRPQYRFRHWGTNINIQDRINLYGAKPK